MVKQVGLHEIAVALLMMGGQAQILIQIHGANLCKAQIALLKPLHQLLVSAHGGSPGGQSQHTVRLINDLGGDDIGRPAAHGLIGFCLIDAHVDRHLSHSGAEGSPVFLEKEGGRILRPPLGACTGDQQ